MLMMVMMMVMRRGRRRLVAALLSPPLHSRGYAFVNFLSLEFLREFHRVCTGRPFDGAPASKLCTVIVSTVQGIRGPRSMLRKKSAGKRCDAVEPLFVQPRPAASLSRALAHWGAPPPSPHAPLAVAMAAVPLPTGFREPPGLERFPACPLRLSV